MMKRLRRKFTEWYFRKGYTFGYDFTGIETIGGDDIFPAMPTSMPRAVWNCPWYVKPFLFLFSPSIYFCEITKSFAEDFAKGLSKGLEENDKL